MPKRTSSQRIGDVGENMVRELVDSHASWMCRAQDRDFGVDLEAELAPLEGEDQLPSGKLIKLQVKSSQVVDRSGSRVAISLDQGFLQYSNQFRVPVLLIAVELSTRRAWWIWLQAWWLENEVRLASAAPTASRTVHIPEGQTLEAGLDGPWRSIAMGQTPEAVVMALREVVAFSASDKDHGDLLESALDLLDKLASINRTWAVEKILDDMTGLGPHAGFWQTSQYARPLMITVRRLGDLLTAEQVVRMVRRGETYSRAGLHGLSQLYDSWPEHAGSLGLPELFKGIGAIEMEWYTLAREHYHDLDGFQLMSAFAAGKLSKRRFGRAALAEDEDLGTRLWSSWPDRGDSALLDNLSLAEVPPA